MKKRYLAGLVVIALAGIAVVYASKNGRTPENVRPQPGGQTQSAAGHQGHGVPKPQEEAVQETAPQAPQEEAPIVEIPLDKQRMIGVRTVEVAVRPLQKVIRTVGRVEYDERRIATVNSKFEGWIEKLYIDYTGRYVKKGEPLAGIYSPELVATQQEFINALKWARQSGDAGGNEMKSMLSSDAHSLVEAARQRLKFWDISDEQIKKIEESGKPVRTLTLYSPASGYVVQKMAFQGMRAMPGEKLFDIADLSSVWILSDIYEYELPVIRAGQTARISLSYLPGKEFTSTIEYVYPALSGEARTAKVRFTIANPGGQLKPQMFSTVEVKVPMGRRLAVPDEVILDTGRRQIVYVDKGDGYFEPREVKTGIKAEGFQEILAGLHAGEKVASSATFLIDSEAQLKGVTPLAGAHKH